MKFLRVQFLSSWSWDIWVGMRIQIKSTVPCNKGLEQDNVHLGGTNAFMEQ